MDRRCARALLFTAILSAAVLIAVYVVQSQAGLKSKAHGADWASHLAMVDLILRGENVRAHGAQIGTGIVSPLFAHGIAAALSSVTGLSTIRVIGVVASLAAIVSVVVAAARSVWVVLAVAQNRLARLAGWLVAAAAFFVLAALGLGFYGQIDQTNYFFSQTVGTALALLALSAVQVGMAREGRAALLAIVSVPILAFILAKIHLVPALWFAAAGAICALALARPFRQRLVVAGLLAVLSVLLILSVPASREVLQLPQAARGVLNLRLASVVPRWRGDKIDLDNIPTPSPLIFFGGWGAPGGEGRPAYAPAAHVAFNIASATGALQLCLRVRASPAGARPFVSTFAINGSEIRTETFPEGDHPRHVALQLSGRQGDTVLSILNRPETAPAVAGNHGSLLLKAIWLAPTCGRVGVSVDEHSAHPRLSVALSWQLHSLRWSVESGRPQ